MYSLEVIEKSIRTLDTQQLIERWKGNLFSEESLPIAENELRQRGIDPNGLMPDPEPLPPEPVSDFSLNDLPLWRQFFTFKGRTTRTKFWLVFPACWLSFLILSVQMQILISRNDYSILLFSLYGLLIPITWVYWATIVQRLHDRNLSGHHAFILFIPIFGLLWALIELGCRAGTIGPNRFGRNQR
jgi:uncharacterized membrane protein YhaH (DUF805 family)